MFVITRLKFEVVSQRELNEIARAAAKLGLKVVVTQKSGWFSTKTMLELTATNDGSHASRKQFAFLEGMSLELERIGRL